jgi:hypothetical protein
VQKKETEYSSWEEKHKTLGTLNIGDEVTLVAAVNVIREPDTAVVTSANNDPLLKAGDRVLRYGLNSDGFWNIWVNGAWNTVSEEDVVEKGSFCGFSDKTECYIAITKDGVKEWWIEVRTDTGQEGWVLAGKSTHGNRWYSGIFGELCMLD